MKLAATSLFIVGLSGSLIYAFIIGRSGQTLGSFEVVEKSSSFSGLTLPIPGTGGATVSVGGQGYRSKPEVSEDAAGPISLAPENNPIRVTVSASYTDRMLNDKITIGVRLVDSSGNQVWEASSAFGRGSKKTGKLKRSKENKNIVQHKSVTFGEFSVPAAGDYTLLFRIAEKGRADLKGLSAEVRINVTPVNWAILGPLLAITVFGAVMLAIAKRAS